jgi:hypothetical protein
LENNSRHPRNLTEKNRQGDSLNKSQFTLCHGVDEGGIVAAADDE